MRIWELLRLALGGLRRTPLRVALTALGVAIASGALVSMVSLALGIQNRVEEQFRKLELINRIDVSSGRAAERPSPAGGPAKDGHAPLKEQPGPLPLLDDAALARIAALPGVTLAYPELRLRSLEIVRAEQPPLATTAAALPRAAARLPFVSDALVAGRFFERTGQSEAVLGVKLSKTLGFAAPADALGRTLVLDVRGLAPTAARTFVLEQRRVEVRVVGVWDPPGLRRLYTADGLLLPLDLMKGLPGVQSETDWERIWDRGAGLPGVYGRAVVRVERPRDLFDVEEAIRAMGFQAQTFLGQIRQMRTGFILMDLVLSALGGVALVVAGLGIVNTLLMAVLERYREIGTYKALGASDGDVRLLFLAEAALVGLLGGGGGLILGRVVSWIIERIVNTVAHKQGVEGPILVFAFPPGLLLGAVAFAVVMSLLSGVYPASRAARFDPIRALRAE